MFGSRRRDEMHRVALTRLRSGRQTIEEYFRVRFDQRLDETFDAWGEDISEADRAPAATQRDGTNGS